MSKPSPNASKPLTGVQILVTRASAQAGPLADRLEALGGTVICKPLLAFSAPDSWDALDRAVEKLDSFNWIIFASTNAVEAFHGRLTALSATLNCDKSKLAAIGPATAQVIEKYGWKVSFQPDEFVAEGLISQFPGMPDLSGIQILWPKTNIGRLLLAEELKNAGATVSIVDCYKTTCPEQIEEIGDEIASLLKTGKLDAITLASSETARNLARALRHEDNATELLRHCAIVVIGPETAKAVQQAFPDIRVHQATTYTMQGLTEMLCEVFKGDGLD